MPKNYKTNYQNKFRPLLYTILVFNGIVFLQMRNFFVEIHL